MFIAPEDVRKEMKRKNTKKYQIQSEIPLKILVKKEPRTVHTDEEFDRIVKSKKYLLQQLAGPKRTYKEPGRTGTKIPKGNRQA